MKDELLPYYENELSFIRHKAGKFGAAYGKIAERLALSPDTCADPHVERLIEAFALLTARVHHKIDDEFPEITEALINVLYPHYLRPLPSMAIAQFHADTGGSEIPDGYAIEKGTGLYSREVSGHGTSCTFRTCYDVRLWPFDIKSATVLPAASASRGSFAEETTAIIRIDLGLARGTRIPALSLDKLRFYLSGESHVVHTLYELLFNNVVRIELHAADSDFASDLPVDVIRPVGFARNEGMLPYPDHSFLGYRILQEYFSFPQKYLFFDLCGLDNIEWSRLEGGFQIWLHLNAFERRERLRHLEQNVSRETFKLGCTPIINLFERLAEPVRLTHSATEYRLVPDVHRSSATEVYSVNQVTSTASYLDTAIRYEPFYSVRHNFGEEPGKAFWYASRKSSEEKYDRGTEVYLSLVNLGFEPALPPVETLSVQVTCTNRELAGELPFLGEPGELLLESGSLVAARCIVPPTKPVRPPLRRDLQWRLISHLSLNHLSLVKGGSEALQEVLRLYDFTEDPVVLRQIAGIVSVSSHPHMASITSEYGIGFVQGLRVQIKFDEDAFVDYGAFLFASVLERFLGLYTSINSFTQLTAETPQRKGVLKRWPPRSGEQILL